MFGTWHFDCCLSLKEAADGFFYQWLTHLNSNIVPNIRSACYGFRHWFLDLLKLKKKGHQRAESLLTSDLRTALSLIKDLTSLARLPADPSITSTIFFVGVTWDPLDYGMSSWPWRTMFWHRGVSPRRESHWQFLIVTKTWHPRGSRTTSKPPERRERWETLTGRRCWRQTPPRETGDGHFQAKTRWTRVPV